MTRAARPLRVDAAVDVQRLTRDVLGEVGGHVQHQVRHFLERGVSPVGDHRSTLLAQFLGLTRRPAFLDVARIIGVSTGPGQTALTRMPLRATSRAAVFVRPITACLLAM